MTGNSLTCGPALVLAAAIVASHLPRPHATPSADNPPQVAPQPHGAQLHIPLGFSVEVWAQGFEGRPVASFQMADGNLLVTDDGGRKIWRVSYGK